MFSRRRVKSTSRASRRATGSDRSVSTTTTNFSGGDSESENHAALISLSAISARSGKPRGGMRTSTRDIPCPRRCPTRCGRALLSVSPDATTTTRFANVNSPQIPGFRSTHQGQTPTPSVPSVRLQHRAARQSRWRRPRCAGRHVPQPDRPGSPEGGGSVW